MPVILITAEIMNVFGIGSNATMTKFKSAGASVAVVGRNAWDAKLFFDWYIETIAGYDPEGETDTQRDARDRYWSAKATIQNARRSK